MAKVGYIRVSSKGHNPDRQLDDVLLDKTFTDHISGKSTDRPQLKACLEYLREGDTLHVHSMDRLSRSLVDIQKLVEDLTALGITVFFRKESLTFTGQDTPMAKLMMQIMGGVAEFERSLIRERQAEGIRKAQEKGIRFGRQPKLCVSEIQSVVDQVKAGRQKKDVAVEFGISRPTLYKYLRQEQKNEKI